MPKLKALAQYADDHGDEFERIVAIGVEKDSALFGIDMKSSAVRKAVYESAADAGSIKALFDRHGTKYTTIVD